MQEVLTRLDGALSRFGEALSDIEEHRMIMVGTHHMHDMLLFADIPVMQLSSSVLKACCVVAAGAAYVVRPTGKAGRARDGQHSCE